MEEEAISEKLAPENNLERIKSSDKRDGSSPGRIRRRLEDRKQEIKDKWEAKKAKMIEDRKKEREKLKQMEENE